MKYELYIGNHRLNTGIEDYIYTVKNIFAKNNINIDTVETISEDVDFLFIIENFIDAPKGFFQILKNKRSQGVKIILINTEFVDKNIYFNIFSIRDLFFRRCIFADLVVKFYRLRKYIFVRIFFFISVAFYVLLGFVMGFKFIDIKKRISFSLRDSIFSKVHNIFHYHLVFSDDLYNCLSKNPKIKNCLYLQHYFDLHLIEKFQKRELNNNLLYFTGYKTFFRKKFIRSQNSKIYNNYFHDTKVNINQYNFLKRNFIDFNLLFTDEETIAKIVEIYKKKFNVNINKFEIYIPQRYNWSYLSTMRIIRSLKNESIPINVGIFNKSKYEKLSINVESLDFFIKNYKIIIKNYYSKLRINIEEFNFASFKAFTEFNNDIKQ